MSDNHHGPESDHHPHVLPLAMYFGVGAALLVLTVTTVWTAKFMPEVIFEYTKMQITPTIAIIIAMIIAFVKASLVCAFFMHLKFDGPLNRAVFISGLFFLSLFFLFTLADTLTRQTEPVQRQGMPEAFKTLTEIPHKPYQIAAMPGYCDHGVLLEGAAHPCHVCHAEHGHDAHEDHDHGDHDKHEHAREAAEHKAQDDHAGHDHAPGEGH